jgi:drug/metabolite transporter (DMT)-like permease
VNQERQAIVYGLAAVACWSTVATAFKLSLAYLDTFQLVFYSTLVASSALLAVVLVRHGHKQLFDAYKGHSRLTFISGLMNPVVYYLILFKAYDLLPAQVAQPINYTLSIVLTLMAIVFLKQ